MPFFRVLYRKTSHQWLDVSKYKHEPSGECVFKEKSSQKWDIHGIPREHRITNLSHPLNATLSENNIAQMIDSLSVRKVRIHRCILYLQPVENGIKETELSNVSGEFQLGLLLKNGDP